MKKKPKPQSWRDEILEAYIPFTVKGDESQKYSHLKGKQKLIKKANVILGNCRTIGVPCPWWARVWSYGNNKLQKQRSN